MLRDVSKVSTRVQLQGEWVESPVGVAPTAMQKMANHEGEAATARGIRGLSVVSHQTNLSSFSSLCCYWCVHDS